jgi:hypothetical protein
MDSCAVTFNTAIRAPCEGYVLNDYAAYTILQVIVTNHAYVFPYRPLHTDRSWTGYSFSLSTSYSKEFAHIPTNGTGGGNYVDADLKVIVLMDTDTAMVSSLLTCYMVI